jgi:hypothetical protein
MLVRRHGPPSRLFRDGGEAPLVVRATFPLAIRPLQLRYVDTVYMARSRVVIQRW